MHCCKNLFLLNVKDLYSHMLCRSPSHDIYWGLEIGLRGLIRASSADIGHAFLFGLLVDPFQQLFRLPFSAGTGGISVGLPIGWVENSIWMEWKCIFYDITNGESHWYASPFGPTHNPHSLAKTLPIYIIGKKGKKFCSKLSYLKFKILTSRVFRRFLQWRPLGPGRRCGRLKHHFFPIRVTTRILAPQIHIFFYEWWIVYSV